MTRKSETKKNKKRAFAPPLDKPITEPKLPIGLSPGDLAKWAQSTALNTTQARFAKWPALIKHYGLETEDKARQPFLLAWFLACEFVPGFQTRSDGRAGHSEEFLRNLATVVMCIKRLKLASSDIEACGVFAELENPDLEKQAFRRQRVARARTLQNLLPRARALPKRRLTET